MYLTASLGVVHYWWLVKADVSRPIAYGIVVGSLLAFRIWLARARAAVAPTRRLHTDGSSPKREAVGRAK